MTEAEWTAGKDPRVMLRFVRGLVSDIKLRLFACVCCRTIWHLYPADAMRRAVVAAELYANKAAMLTKHNRRKPEDRLTADEEVKDPFVLEFLGLKDEYSETEIEEALIHHLETFLLELGGDFTSSAASGAYALAAPGIGSTCCFSIADCAAWSSST